MIVILYFPTVASLISETVEYGFSSKNYPNNPKGGMILRGAFR